MKYILPILLLATPIYAASLDPTEPRFVIMMVDVGFKGDIETLFLKEVSTPKPTSAKTETLQITTPIKQADIHTDTKKK